MSDPVYLDHNATTPVHPAVVDAMLPFLREHFGNPSSGHVYGRRAHDAVDRARTQVAALLGCEPDEVFFTSGGTEANNLAISGVLDALGGQRPHVLTSAVEHPATARPCDRLERHGREVTRVPVDGDGRVRVEDVRPFVRGDTALLTVMLANNETGALMPIRELADLAHAKGALVHTDAAQAVGKLPVRVDALEVDLLSVAGHKLYAPKGVGALYVRRGTPIRPVLLGAGHERGLRPGTENVPHIVALGAACELAGHDLDTEPARQRALRDDLWSHLLEGVPGIRLNGPASERLPNTLNVAFPGVRGSAVLAAAPEVAASTGSACHEGDESPSGVLTAMGMDPATALGSVRLSLGRSTDRMHVADAATALIRAWRIASESCAE
ncbi:MAG: cysteine desulfurase [Deltaproteobacteria bacterium]|nr:cysteine desulfurase [Deltaproteobacteria bacterium]